MERVMTAGNGAASSDSPRVHSLTFTDRGNESVMSVPSDSACLH